MCAAQVPGDTQRNLEIHPTFSAQTFKHILVPVWLLAYTYGAKTFQVLVNGATGGWPASIRRASGRSRSSCCSGSLSCLGDDGRVNWVRLIGSVLGCWNARAAIVDVTVPASADDLVVLEESRCSTRNSRCRRRPRRCRAARRRCRCRRQHHVQRRPARGAVSGRPRAGDVRARDVSGAPRRSSGSCRASTRPPSATPRATRRTRRIAKSAAA